MNTLLAIAYLLVFPGFLFLFTASLFGQYMDRKLYARIQRRVGPPLLQPFADFIKLSAKEDVVPDYADKVMFTAAPIFAVAAVFVAFLFLPVLASQGLHSFQGDLIVVLYLLMIPTLAMFLGGWYSGNVFGVRGGMRVASLLFSYEIPFFVALLTPALLAGTWRMSSIVGYENAHPLVIVASLLGFVIGLIALQGKLERLPFDIPEAETEIVAGPLVEYSGRRFALFRLARDAELFVGAGLLAVLFLGGPYPLFVSSPTWLMWINGGVMFLLKTFFIIFILILIKSAVARIRTDQMVNLAYKWLIPLALVQITLVVVLHAFGGIL